jgi:hypothetical protein
VSLAYAVAWLVPLLLGTALVALASGRRPRPGWAASTGGGITLGMLLCASAVGLLGPVEVKSIRTLLLPLLLSTGCALAVVAAMRRRGITSVAPAPSTRVHPLGWCLLALLAAHAWLIAGEVLLRPPYPWDAWAIWLLKPKAWMLEGRIVPFVDFARWLADSGGTLRTADAWAYPEAIAHVAIWFAAAWGSWNAIAVDVAWFVLWVALLLGCHGHLRDLGLDRTRALVATYALGSLPLLDVHVALAGYADLWIAATLAFSCLHWLRWLERRGRGDLILALVFACLLPTIKLEGWAWLLILVGTMVYERMRPRMRRIALLLAPLIGAGAAAASLMRWPPFGWLLDRLDLGLDPATQLAHAPAVIAATAIGMFAQYNWHLFWFAVALTLALRWRVLLESHALRVLGLFLLLGCGFLFVLFVLTPAGRWAESYTVVNRLGLQVVPAMLVFTALLWRDAERSAVRLPVAPRPLPSPSLR